MAESIVVVPYDQFIGLDASKDDYDFIGFSFNGIFSINDKFKIYRVSDGSRYTHRLGASNTEKTAENTGGDGTYYFGTLNRSKSFQVNFVFDDLTDSGLRELKDWLCTDQLADLWFYEEPYKVYTAKPVGEPNLKFIAFDGVDDQNRPIRLYKGEGTVEFVAYWPYAHTPDGVLTKSGGLPEPGKDSDSYSDFRNCAQWLPSSGLTNDPSPAFPSCLNPGQIPAYFTVTDPYTILFPGGTIKVGKDNQISIPACRNLTWDSQKGTVVAEPVTSYPVVIPGEGEPDPNTYGPSQFIIYTGNPCGTIPVGGISGNEEEDKIVVIIEEEGEEVEKDFNLYFALDYHYWYR